MLNNIFCMQLNHVSVYIYFERKLIIVFIRKSLRPRTVLLYLYLKPVNYFSSSISVVTEVSWYLVYNSVCGPWRISCLQMSNISIAFNSLCKTRFVTGPARPWWAYLTSLYPLPNSGVVPATNISSSTFLYTISTFLGNRVSFYRMLFLSLSSVGFKRQILPYLG